MNRKWIVVIAFAICLVVIVPIAFLLQPNHERDFVDTLPPLPSHKSVGISSDGDFNASNGVVSGTGSVDDPYVIEGWAFTSGTSSSGLGIWNTRAYFIVRGVYAASAHYSSIALYNVSHGTIEDSVVYDTYYGIRIDRCSGITITNCTFSDCHAGLSIATSETVTVESNKFMSCGVTLEGKSPDDFSSISIDTTNAVNGKPLRFFKDTSSVRLEGDVLGQLIVVNCTDFLASNLSISHADWGIEVLHSDGFTVTDCEVSRNRIGIVAVECDDMRILDSVLEHNENHIQLTSSNDSLIRGNTIEGNLTGERSWGYAIDIEDSVGANIDTNRISNCAYGINLFTCDLCVVSANTLRNAGIIVGNGSYTISSDNSVNGMPVGYYQDKVDVTVDGDEIGQLMLVRCTGVRVSNLRISDTDTGIALINVRGGLITSNVLHNCMLGMRLWECSDLRIYHNDFIDNDRGTDAVDTVDWTTHIGSYSSPNIWDGGYPEGGNYWSDFWWTTDRPYMDRFSGPNQDLPGSDGIIDQSKSDFEFVDRYPLLNPANGASEDKILDGLASEYLAAIVLALSIVAAYVLLRRMLKGKPEEVQDEASDLVLFDQDDKSA